MAEYFSAMFRRRPNDGWFQAGRFDLTTTDILCALGVVTMFVYGIMGREDFHRLPFRSWLVREELELWRLFSWPVATQPNAWGLLGVVFFWVFGQQLEALFGREKFLAWILAVTVGPAVIVTALGAVSTEIDTTNYQYGLSTLFVCGIWVYAATYPQARWFDVVPLWAVGAVFTLLEVLQYNGDGMTGMVVFVLLAIGIGLSAARSLGQATGWPIPHIPVADGHHRPARSGPTGRGRQVSGGRHPAPPRPNVGRSGSVVEGPWTAPPPPARNGPDARAAQAELDLLLDKISGSGLDSLTASEKKRLNELSKQLRG
jgi:hypothetical protein